MKVMGLIKSEGSNEKKRILVVSQHFWPESFRINDICDSFVEQGYDVEVLCGIPNYPKGQFFDGYGLFKNKRQTINGIKVRRCFEIKRGKNTSIRIFLNYISFPFFSIFSLPYLFRQKYDKIFLFQTSPVMMSLAGVLLGKIKKIETTMYVLDLWPENLYSVLKIRNGLLRKLAYWSSTWYYRNTDKLIANSQKLMGILKERTKKEDSHIAFIPQFCEKIYEATIENEELNKRFSNTFNLVYAGNISPAQSFETVMEAASLLKVQGYNNIAWIIVGDGMSRKWLESEVQQKELGDRFTFIGHVPIEEIPKYTSIADGLFACLTKTDLLDATIPAKVFSYYAAGRPLVLAMDGEIQQIVQESGAGYIVDSGDAVGLADTVAKLYNTNKDERYKMGENAQEYYFKHFERNLNMEKLIGFIFDEQK